MNPIMQMLNKNNSNMMLKALMAMKSGKSPEAFLKEVCQGRPELSNIDFNDLKGSAEAICKARGLNIEDVKSQVESTLNSLS